MDIYFHMRIEKFLFINGSNKDQIEIAESENHDIPRGFFGNKDTVAVAIRDKIDHISANAPYY